jgi:hypothetical protein
MTSQNGPSRVTRPFLPGDCWLLLWQRFLFW